MKCSLCDLDPTRFSRQDIANCTGIFGKPCPQHVVQQQREEPALRYDAGKVRYELIPADALEELARVYTRGASKYADRNWEKGMSWGRCFGSLMRHSWKFWSGERDDPETGCHHMAMAAWNCFALLAYSLRAAGTDDRANGEQNDK